MGMRISTGSGRAVVAGGGVASLATLVACNAKGGRTDYSKSPDSGAVAPAMQQDTSMSRTYPDSTAGGPGRTGKSGAAGDTLSTRGRPTGTGVVRPDTTKKRP